jgi:hypothetical protein
MQIDPICAPPLKIADHAPRRAGTVIMSAGSAAWLAGAGLGGRCGHHEAAVRGMADWMVSARSSRLRSGHWGVPAAPPQEWSRG